jgi:apolipoprotein N-acyltransferase
MVEESCVTAAPSPSTPAPVIWLAPLLSAALLWLCFFPVACGWLAWVALVPWLCLVRAVGRPRRLYLAAWAGGLAFYWPVLQWMRVADPRMYFTWGALATYCAAYIPVVLFLVRWLDRRTRLPLVISFPAAWVAVEFWRYGFIGSFASVLLGHHQHDYPGGFSWYLLGHSQHDFLEMIQIADLTGVYGVTFLVAAVNALLFEILYARNWVRHPFLGADAAPRQGRVALLVQGIGVAALLLASLGYGTWRMGEETQTPGPRLALLQGNVDQRIRNLSTGPEGEERDRARRRLRAHFADLADVAAKHHVDLIVWPETSFPGVWAESPPGAPWPESRDTARLVARRWHTPQLLGTNAEVRGDDEKIRAYNSAVLIDREGRWQGRYDKIHRVPFGEYIPVRSLLPWLAAAAPYDYDYSVSPGTQFTRFPLRDGTGRDTTFGVVICYEDTDPGIARPYLGSDGKPPADFLLNSSNDGWFNGTSEHDQHLAICRFRAIECRRSVARAVNMGISAVIDSNGRVLAPEEREEGEALVWEVHDGAAELPVSRWHEYKQVAGVLLASVPLDTRASLYARWGDWFATGCGALVLLSFGIVWVGKRLGATA